MLTQRSSSETQPTVAGDCASDNGDNSHRLSKQRKPLSHKDILRILNYPNDMKWNCTVLLIVDPTNGPYGLKDFVPALERIINIQEIIHAGSSIVTHAFTLGLKSEAAAEKLLNAREIEVKGKPCIITAIGSNRAKITIHWLPPEIRNELIVSHFVNYGKVLKCENIKCREPGLEHILTDKRSILLELKQGVVLDDIPHMIKVKGITASITVPGRTPMCYKCRKLGHVRRECREERCVLCKRYGHSSEMCNQNSYAERVRKDWAAQMEDVELNEPTDEGDLNEYHNSKEEKIDNPEVKPTLLEGENNLSQISEDSVPLDINCDNRLDEPTTSDEANVTAVNERKIFTKGTDNGFQLVQPRRRKMHFKPNLTKRLRSVQNESSMKNGNIYEVLTSDSSVLDAENKIINQNTANDVGQNADKMEVCATTTKDDTSSEDNHKMDDLCTGQAYMVSDKTLFSEKDTNEENDSLHSQNESIN